MRLTVRIVLIAVGLAPFVLVESGCSWWLMGQPRPRGSPTDISKVTRDGISPKLTRVVPPTAWEQSAICLMVIGGFIVTSIGAYGGRRRRTRRLESEP